MEIADKKLIDEINIYLEKNKNSIISEVQDLVRKNSVVDIDTITEKKPHGNNIHNAYRHLAKYLKSNKDVVAKYYKTKNNSLAYYDAFAPFNTNRENENTKDSRYLLFACHLDTVGFGNVNEWHLENPISGALSNGYIFGRGTVDDKGSIVMVLWALRYLKQANIKIPFNIRCFIGGDEEIGCATQPEYSEANQNPSLTLVPDGEFPFSYGEKCVYVFEISISALESKIISINATNIANMVPGFCEVVIEVDIRLIERSFKEYLYENNLKGELTKVQKGVTKILLRGVSCHAISANEGMNAICYMFNFLLTKSIIYDSIAVQYINNFLFQNLYGDLFGINAFDKVANTGSNMNVGTIELQNKRFLLKLNIRFLPKLISADKILKQIRLHSEKFFCDKHDFNIKVVVANPGFQHNLELQPWTQIYHWLQEVSGDYKTKPILSAGGSYARLFPNAINIGPVLSTQKYKAHCVNEKIKVESLLTAIKYYIYILVMLTKNPKIF